MRQLLKAILKTGSGSVVTVLFGMLAVKLIALRLGAGALGSFSLVKQVIVAGSAMFVTGGQTALVQGLSSRKGTDRNRYEGTAFVLLCGGSLFVGIALAALSTLVRNSRIFGENSSIAMCIAGTAVALAGPMAFVFGSLNAQRRIGRLAIAQAVNSLALATAAWIVVGVVKSSDPRWFAAAIAVSQLPGICLGMLFLAREANWRISAQVEKPFVIAFGKIAFATFAGAALQGWTVLFIRASVASQRGLTAAGLFDAGWTISMVYVMLVLGSFTTYYLPTLSATRGPEAARLIENVLRTSLLIVVPLISAMMALRPLMLTLLYSKEFLPAVGMMHWMLLGDFLKVASFVVAMPMIAFADTRVFLGGEVGWNLLMAAGTSLVLRSGWSSEWLGAVFALSYLAYFAYAWIYCRRKTGLRLDRRLVVMATFGCTTLFAVSWITWGELRVSASSVIAALTLSAVHVAICLRRAGSWAEPDLAYSRAS